MPVLAGVDAASTYCYLLADAEHRDADTWASVLRGTGLGDRECISIVVRLVPMPHKANTACRHHIPRAKRRVTNWAEYDAALRQRGSLTVWFSEEAIAGWKASPRTARGGQPLFSNMAMQTGLILRRHCHVAIGLALSDLQP